MPVDPKSLLPLPAHVFQILLSLKDRPLHGYALIQDIAERTDGEMLLGTSTLYAALKRLLASAVLEETNPPPRSESDDERRRYYRATTFGRAVLREEARRIERLHEMVTRARLAGASSRARGR
jgi:DNA-binding PadR family transcriptional regulator